ncbi:hypothetical protein N7478_008694 [Penicillium angulare]|uniref:uncharacterized protein n=1 Tax=Penicillium angulare TaxID=116970 RepID=UPI00254101FA|nr:uncharacterized protein N7478_008694 [Penicillium angulare]KAJ5273569.1 hypothetical protein N7478_008694 [Penicillium angulare]
MSCKPEPRPACSSGRCSEQRDERKTNDASIPKVPSQARSESNRTTQRAQKENHDRPSCCKDKPSPCCDNSCLDRIALRECDKGRTSSPNHASPKYASSGCHDHDGEPCEQHLRSTRNKYAAILEALGCICRALVELGQESCCAPSRASSLRSARRSTESSRSILRVSLGTCCKNDGKGFEKRSNLHLKEEAACQRGCCGAAEAPPSPDQSATTKEIKGRNCNTGCWTKPQISETVEEHASVPKGATGKATGCSKGCCGKPKELTDTVAGEKPDKLDIQGGSCCKKSGPSACCFPKERSSDSIEISQEIGTPDLEKGFTGKEHVILSISGMTCTGCETKLKRALGTLQSVQNLKISLVLSRAEFELNTGLQSLDEVLKHLGKTTEFKYERFSNRGSNMDVVVSDAPHFAKQDWPRGVTEVTIFDEKTLNIAFDAEIIGARDLLTHGWGRPLSLAGLRADPALAAGSKHVRHMGYMTILSIILTLPVLVLAWAPLPKREIAYGSASLTLATIVQIVIAGPFYPKALKALVFSKIIEMDLLIVLSTSAAYIFSVVSFGYLVVGKSLATGEFFETSTLLVTLIMFGRYVAALARQKAVESISVRSLQTSIATLVDESGANEQEIDVRLFQYGDIFKVVPDSKIPTDGTVISGSSEVNESMLTGESIPVDKSPGSVVVAGSVNGSGTLIVQLTSLPADNTISTIAGMVDQAKLSKPKIQDIADKVASYFVPAVITLTIITFGIWIAVGITVRKYSGSRATTEAITYAITVLIVSCPCAVGLAVPMVIVISSGVAAERGIVFKAADSIELAYRTSHVVFDKTGTLTRGKLTVTVEHINHTENAMSLLLGLIGCNKHPISAAVAAHLQAKGISASAITDSEVLTGKGVEGNSSGLILRAGNSRWLNLSSNPQVQSVLKRGYTAFCFTVNNGVAAVFGLEDSPRHDALETVTKLQERGITTHILSGDDEGPVNSIARQLGIKTENVRSRCSPIDKQAYIQDLLTIGHQALPNKANTTIFIGDGTNDAVALATSTIGVHMNQDTGSDVAKSAADVVLMQPILLNILTLINISEKAVRRIKFNFWWSFVYNLFAILLGAGAFVDARIPPQYAGLGELVSVLPVVTAAVLLRWTKV